MESYIGQDATVSLHTFVSIPSEREGTWKVKTGNTRYGEAYTQQFQFPPNGKAHGKSRIPLARWELSP